MCYLSRFDVHTTRSCILYVYGLSLLKSCSDGIYNYMYNVIIYNLYIYNYIYYQELMKEGASDCVERHLNLNDCDTSLLWTYSQVGHKCCFHSQRITPRAARKRICIYVRVYTALARGDSKLRFTITAMEQEREGEIERLRKRQATTPHRTAKRSRRSCEVRPCLAPRK